MQPVPPSILLPEGPSQYYLPIYGWVFQVVYRGESRRDMKLATHCNIMLSLKTSEVNIRSPMCAHEVHSNHLTFTELKFYCRFHKIPSLALLLSCPVHTSALFI